MSLDFLKVTNEGGDKPIRIDLFGRVGGGYFDDGINEETVKQELGWIDENATLDIYINTVGGSVFTALAIYNLLKRHKGEITINVAGLVASAGTIITSIPNAKVVMPKGSLMLVHPVRQTLDGGQTPEEMMESAENLCKIRNAIIDIFEQKTKQSKEELLMLMQKESMLTATEAVDLGFADVYDSENEVKNSVADVAMIGGLKVSMDIVSKAPDGFFKAEKSADKDGEEMNLEQLKAEHPDIVEAIRNEAMAEAVQAERSRIKAIEDMAVGHEEMVADAKFVSAMTPEAFAMAVLKAEKAERATMLNNIQQDAKELDGVTSDGNLGIDVDAENKAKEEAEMKAIIKAGASAYSGK